MVGGMTTGQQGVINARVVMQGRCARHEGPGPGAPEARGEGKMGQHAAAGTIKAINGSNLTVTTQRGQEVTIATTTDTAVLNNGFKAVNTLKVGDK
jgi:hypothetical protein